MQNKMERIAERIRRWKEGEKLGPWSIQLNPTNRCNLECKFCWQRTPKDIDYTEVDDERYLDLIEEAKSLGVKEIEITGGGEPLMRKDLTIKMIQEIKKRDIYGRLITNGTYLEESDLDLMVKHGFDEIIFSVDGPEETHEYLRQLEGCFEETISSMNYLSTKKNSENSDLPRVTMHMVLCNENYDEIHESVKIAKKTGCDNFFIEPVVTLAFDTDIGKKLKMKDDEIKKTLENLKKAKKYAEREGLNHNLGSLKEELLSRTNRMDQVIKEDVIENSSSVESIFNAACYEPWYNMIIRPEGFVGPCCMFDNEGPDIKKRSLEKIWFGEYFQKIRKNMINHELLSFCSKCNPSQVSDNRELRDILTN